MKETITQKKVLIPIGNRVLIEPIIPEKITASGIIITGQVENQERPGMGIIRAIGKPEKGEIELDVEIGDTVMYAKYTGEHIEFEDKKYVVIRMDSLLVKINTEENSPQ